MKRERARNGAGIRAFWLRISSGVPASVLACALLLAATSMSSDKDKLMPSQPCMHRSHTRSALFSLMLAVGVGACSDDFSEPPRNLDGAVFIPPNLDGSIRPIDAGVLPTGIDSGFTAVDAAVTSARPNILLLVADDLGYSDIGAYGGEISTPNLDTLAAEGRLLTQHHSAATCSPTRSMLLSGTDHHLVGLGTMAEVLQPEQVGKPGYEGYLNQKSLSIAQLLQDSGYHTYMAGKWHLGLTEDKSPKAWGFESSFVLTSGAAAHFAPREGAPTAAEKVVYREDGVQTTVPADFFSSDFYASKLISYLDAHAGDGKPFFAYAAFTAPHWPLQAPADFIDRYRGRYDAGYDAIRNARLAKQKQLGIIPQDFQPNPGLPASETNPKWEALTPEQRQSEARRMEIYAAMVENLDHNIGRLIQYLKRTGQYDNTFVFFESDNGAEGGTGFPDVGADNSFANLGKVGSNVNYGKRWAEVSATPFRLWKAYSSEGGVSVPAIARLPKSQSGQKLFSGFSHVSDLAPTFLELARAADPGTNYKGREVFPITGHSLLPVLQDRANAVRAPGEVLVDELFGRRYVRKDQWKLTWVEAPYGTSNWQLYNIDSDRGENTDLATQQPDVFNALTGEWDKYVTRVGVVLPLTPGIPAH
ncbi:MAG: arylsulfatase [Myxococcaceae bacterium]|nr:arylsulfatase [Myxococcaceae bacterium]